ncbi:MAG: type II toxin-antitoxin system death-on-curing family toxin [Chloroflexi bacterium]|nr:type II toxin-antitoxin system death-on-curing family toxin [Chloroflexota bacterium]
MKYLELDEVLRIHERLIIQYGGSFGVLNQGALESALAAPQQTMFGQDLYPEIASKAAILFYLFIKNHAFMDGNKRTGFACLIRCLNVNGYVLNAAGDELYQFTMDVATSVLDKEHVTEWITERTNHRRAI